MLTITRFGFHGVVYYKGQMWLEHEVPNVLCDDYKICHIIKGETLRETFPVIIRKIDGPEGEYQIHLTVNITDDLEMKETIHFNMTVEVKTGGNKSFFSPQIGRL